MDYDQPYQPYQYQEPNLWRQYRLLVAGVVAAIVLLVVIISFLRFARTGTLELSAIKGQGAITVSYAHGNKTDTIKLAEGETKRVHLTASTIRVSASGTIRKSVDIVTIKGRQTTKLSSGV